MTYYKIVQDGNVVDAGFVFLKWNEKHHCMLSCEVNEAQFIQSFDQSVLDASRRGHPSCAQPLSAG